MLWVDAMWLLLKIRKVQREMFRTLSAPLLYNASSHYASKPSQDSACSCHSGLRPKWH